VLPPKTDWPCGLFNENSDMVCVYVCAARRNSRSRWKRRRRVQTTPRPRVKQIEMGPQLMPHGWIQVLRRYASPIAARLRLLCILLLAIVHSTAVLHHPKEKKTNRRPNSALPGLSQSQLPISDLFNLNLTSNTSQTSHFEPSTPALLDLR
jgi:hypothetical protein